MQTSCWTDEPIDDSGLARPESARYLLSLAACVVSLVSVAAMLWACDGNRRLPPEPTSKAVIAELHRLGGRVWADEAGRVIRVELARVPIGDDDLAILSKLPHLQWLNLRGINVFKGTLSNEGLRHISGLTQLRSLNLSANRRLNSPSLFHIRNLKNLEWLNLTGTRIGNEGLIHLRELPRLKRLWLPSQTWRRGDQGEQIWVPGGVTIDGLVHLAGSSIEYLEGSFGGDEMCERLGAIPNLSHYHVTWDSPSDRDLVHLQNWKRMKALQVSLNDGWKDSSRLHLLKGLSNLRTLDLSSAKIGNDPADWSGLAVLGKLRQLDGLRLSGVRDDALAALPQMDSLRRLDLTCSTITGSGFAALARFPNLRELALDRFTVTDDGLAQLRHVPQLHDLHLDTTPFRGDGFSWMYPGSHGRTAADVTFTNDGLRHLKHMPNLRVLFLNEVAVTDAGLAHLQHVESLECLAMQNAAITDAGLVHLRGLLNLESLSFEGSKVTIDAADELHKLIPNCTSATTGAAAAWPFSRSVSIVNEQS
jgi:Leucine-rich repeat (LRR) protein